VRTISVPRSGLNADPTTHYDAADAANNHEFAHPGGTVLLYVENNSGSTMNVTVNAVATASTKQMAEDLTAAVLNGDRWWQPIAYDAGYIASDGNVDIDIDQDTSSYLAVFKIT
jgi:hypothetical protein